MGRLTEQQAAHGFARILGQPLKSYQSDVVARLCERAPDGPGYASQTVLILQPRQTGKTSTILKVLLGRLQTRRGYAAAYTAQTGIVVTHVFNNPDNGWLNAIEWEPMLSARFRCTRSQGREMIIHRDNRGAYLRAFPPTPGRLRSSSLDCVVFDECQEHTQELGQALMADVGPVFTTRPRRQLIMAGTAPPEPSSWWADQIQRGRSGVIPLIEIGTWPDDADPADEDVWREHHPGLRNGLTTVEHLRSELASLGPELFAREYGNRTPGAASLDTPLVDALWKAAQWQYGPPAEPAVIGFDAAPDFSAAAVVAVGKVDGRLVAGVADARPGALWLADALSGMKTRHPAARLAADAASPAAPIIDELKRRRMHVDVIAPAERLAAHGHLITELSSGAAAVMPHPVMDAARAAAVRRWTDEGGWRWSRRSSRGDISALTAWTAALWAARKRSGAGKPRVIAAAE